MYAPFATFFKEQGMDDKTKDEKAGGQHLGAGRGEQQKSADTRQTGKENAPGQSNPRKGEGSETDPAQPVDPAPTNPPGGDVNVNVNNPGVTPSGPGSGS